MGVAFGGGVVAVWGLRWTRGGGCGCVTVVFGCGGSEWW